MERIRTSFLSMTTPVVSCCRVVLSTVFFSQQDVCFKTLLSTKRPRQMPRVYEISKRREYAAKHISGCLFGDPGIQEVYKEGSSIEQKCIFVNGGRCLSKTPQ